MKIKSNLKIGNTSLQFEVDERDDKIAMLKAIGLASPRIKCNVCQQSGLEEKYINAREASSEKGTFIYVSIRCRCGATSTLGEYASKNGWFWKEYVEYRKKVEKGGDIDGGKKDE